MFPKPQVEIIYPNGQKDYQTMDLEYEDGFIESLSPEVKPTISQSKSDRIPLYHQQMAVMNEINRLDLQF